MAAPYEALCEVWWAVMDSNQRPPVCKTDALPTELTAPNNYQDREIVPKTWKMSKNHSQI